jgi:hypothetical protein
MADRKRNSTWMNHASYEAERDEEDKLSAKPSKNRKEKNLSKDR